MTSLLDRLSDTVGKLLFRDLTVNTVATPARGFRHLLVAAPSLRGQPFAAGDKLRLAIPGAGLRTYTPFAFDAAAGTLELLMYLHDGGPAARWAAAVAPGAAVRAFGPRRSLDFSAVRGPVVVVGDETSIGLARALADHGHAPRVVLEATDVDATRAALTNVTAIDGAVVPTRRPAALDAALRRAQDGTEPPTVVLTGNARTISFLRANLRARPASCRAVMTRAYWAEGKRALD